MLPDYPAESAFPDLRINGLENAIAEDKQLNYLSVTAPVFPSYILLLRAPDRVAHQLRSRSGFSGEILWTSENRLVHPIQLPEKMYNRLELPVKYQGCDVFVI